MYVMALKRRGLAATENGKRMAHLAIGCTNQHATAKVHGYLEYLAVPLAPQWSTETAMHRVRTKGPLSYRWLQDRGFDQ